MRIYLLLFLSALLLLFALPKNSSMPGFSNFKDGTYKKSCSYSKTPFKKPCTKKCLKHQTHSEKQNAAVVTDCNQQVYAVLAPLQAEQQYEFPAVQATLLPSVRKHLSPDLEQETEPPRSS